jgi:predicted Zn-dependent protease
MKRWAAFAIVLASLGAALVWCQKTRPQAPVNPDALLFLVADTESELKQLPVAYTRLSDEEEIRIGNQLASSRFLLAGTLDPDDKAVERYVQKVGGNLAVHAERKLPYRFHYLPGDPSIYAFALPGGHIFISAGLMDLMGSEDDLAAVLGHEIEHIDHFHCAERVQTEAALMRIPLGALVALPVEVFEAGYSKDQELEADREGTRLAVMTGYSPFGTVDMLKTLDRLFQEHIVRARTPEEELSRTAEATLEGYFRTYPLTSERIAQIEKMIQNAGWQERTSQRPLEVAYYFKAARARRRLESGKYSEAVKLAEASLRQEPDQPPATATLAAAEFALKQFNQARGLYQSLFSGHPEEAERVVDFALNLASHAIEKSQYADAADYAAHVLDFEPLLPRALVLEAEARFAARDFTGAGEAYRALANKSPNGTGEVIGFAGVLVVRARDEGRTEQAAEYAAHSLELEPYQPGLVETLATIEVTLASFADAAKTFHMLLGWQKDNPSGETMERYADALGAAGNPGAGAVEFQDWFQKVGKPAPALVAESRVEVAGLKLMAGDGGPAHALIFEPGRPESVITYESLGRLGWWYYRAGKYGAAYDVLHNALASRPGEGALSDPLGWVLVEKGEFRDALPRFNEPMGRAVALWLNGEDDKALEAFRLAGKFQPAWSNPGFVRALYSPRVASVVEAMKAEQAQRLRAARR